MFIRDAERINAMSASQLSYLTNAETGVLYNTILLNLITHCISMGTRDNRKYLGPVYSSSINTSNSSGLTHSFGE